jgi:hypothetical protein
MESDWKLKAGINHLGRLFVTSDAATIIREIEAVHSGQITCNGFAV